MDRSFVEALENLATRANSEACTVVIDGTTYCVGPAGPVDPRKAEPQATTLEVHTLGALVEYLKSNTDAIGPTLHMIHVESPTVVSLVSALKGRFRQRERLIEALFLPPVVTAGSAGHRPSARFALNSFMEVERFVVGLRACFDDTTDRDAVLGLVGNVKEEAVRQVGDDGISQEVTTRKGQRLRAATEVPNPVMLAPYRSFPEVTQPVSAFILRLRGGGDDTLPEVGLFEADGGAWALTAVAEIKLRLEAHLEGWVILA